MNNNKHIRKSVCVLLASYNGEKYITQQIESVLNQKKVDVILLVRDDSSTDGTINLLNKFQKDGKLTWFTTPHTNIADAFFTLTERAPEVDYYAFCDQDDIWDENKLSIAVNCLEKNNKNIPAMYCSGSRLVDENNEFICEHLLDTKRTLKARVFYTGIAGNTIVFNQELRNKYITHQPEHCIMHDEWLYKICLFLGGNILIDPNPHLNYRQHSSNVIGMELNLKSKIRKIFKFINNYKTDNEFKEIYSVYKNEIKDNYILFLKDIIDNRKSFKIRWKFITDKTIDFNNIFFSLAFKMKVLLKKL